VLHPAVFETLEGNNMKKDTQNPIALRSKEWLAKALLELMKNKPFREISISEIAEKAKLSRRTFYRSFSSKEEVICFHLQTIWHAGMLQLSSDEDHSYYHTIHWYLELWYEHKRLALLLYRNNLLSLLLQEYNNMFSEVYLIRKGNFPLAKHPEAMKYALSYSAGGLLNVLWQWAGEGMRKSPEEVENLLMVAIQLPDKE
jgi:AcrR family transcriptional regulator